VEGVPVYPLVCLQHPRVHAWASRDRQSTCPHVISIAGAAPRRCASVGEEDRQGWWPVFVRGRPDLRAWREDTGRSEMRATLLSAAARHGGRT
jgi:hypothetical protein